jgi:hypothetical protein
MAKRVLNVATYDGYWASFECERRAAAEVIGSDVDSIRDLDLPVQFRSDPPEFYGQANRNGFTLAKQVKSSKVKRESISV